MQPRCSRDAAEMQPRCSRDAAEVQPALTIMKARRCATSFFISYLLIVNYEGATLRHVVLSEADLLQAHKLELLLMTSLFA